MFSSLWLIEGTNHLFLGPQSDAWHKHCSCWQQPCLGNGTPLQHSSSLSFSKATTNQFAFHSLCCHDALLSCVLQYVKVIKSECAPKKQQQYELSYSQKHYAMVDASQALVSAPLRSGKEQVALFVFTGTLSFLDNQAGGHKATYPFRIKRSNRLAYRFPFSLNVTPHSDHSWH